MYKYNAFATRINKTIKNLDNRMFLASMFFLISIGLSRIACWRTWAIPIEDTTKAKIPISLNKERRAKYKLTPKSNKELNPWSRTP